MDERAWREALGWAVAVVVAYPLLTLVFSECARRIGPGDSHVLRLINVLRRLTLPAAACWVVIHKLARLPQDELAANIIDTCVGVALLFTAYVAAKGVVAALAARTDTPRLLYDIALTVLVSFGAATIIANVWGFSMASLLSAVGVGSLVMGLALQSVIGGMVNGLLVLSGKHFKIGDYVTAGGVTGRVEQIDWQSVTLRTSPTESLILPSSSLATGTFSVADGRQPARFAVTMTFGCEHAPETVRAMLLEAAEGEDRSAARCRVAELSPTGVVYNLSVAVADRGRIDAARDDLLSRIWYVAQRYGISVAADRLAGNLLAHGGSAGERAAILAESGALRRPAEALGDLAAAGRLQIWRVGEIMQRQGEPAASIMVVLRGAVRVVAEIHGVRVELERLGAGQLFSIREAFRALPSPVEVAAAEDCEIMSFPAEAMQALLNRDAELAADIETLLEARAKALKSLKAGAEPERSRTAAPRKPTPVG